MNGTRNHMRQTQTHRAGGVAGGVMQSVRYCVNDAVSMNSVSLCVCKLKWKEILAAGSSA